MEDGLSSNAVVCFLEDERGFMWIGTENGLNRYDGNFVKVWKHDSLNANSPPGNFITNITEDDKGRLWLSCFDKGVSVFDPVTEKFRNYSYDSTNEKSMSQGFVNTIFMDSKKRIWVAAWQGGLSLYDPSTDGFIHFRNIKGDTTSLSSNLVKDIKEDKEGFLWVTAWGAEGFQARVQKFDPEKRKFYNLQVKGKICKPDGTPTDHDMGGLKLMHRILVDSRGDIWFGTYLGTYRYVPSKGLFYEYRSEESDTNAISFNNIRSLCEDDEGNILMGSLGGGLNMYNPLTGKISVYNYDYYNVYSISDNQLRQIFKDREGRIWIGSFTGGANIINPIKQQFSLITNDALHATFMNKSDGNRIAAIGADSLNNLYVYSGSGMSIYHENGSVEVAPYIIPGNERGEVGNAAQIRGYGRKIFISGRHALRYFDPWTKKYELGKFHISLQQADAQSWKLILFTQDSQDGKLWIGRKDAPLLLYDLKADSGRPFTVNGRSITSASCIEEGIAGKLLYGIDETGMGMMDRMTGETKIFRNDSTPDCLGGEVRFILTDRTGTVWVGTSNGLQVFDWKTGKFNVPDHCGELVTEEMLGARADDDGNVWMISPRAVWKYDLAHKKFTAFNRQLGLNSRSIITNYIVRSGNGKFHIACSDGIISFDPKKLIEPSAPPAILLSGIRLFSAYLATDTAAFAKKHLAFHYDENSLTFEFSGIDYVNPRKVSYRYRLIGQDTGWVDCGNRPFASFNNLPSGEYTFEVKCTNSFGLTSAGTASIHFSISPPFWKTWWFYFLEIASGIALVWGYISYRERKLVKEKMKLERVIKVRTAEVVQQKEIIEQKNKEVTDSIHYAQRIQASIIPGDEEFRRLFPQSFVLLRPKDIVSGDYYWTSETEHYTFCATVDCTGHGVPGGFMSMLAGSLLNEIVNESEVAEPAEILSQLSEKVISSLRQGGSSDGSKDGMDMVICRFDKTKSQVTYAGANNGVYLVRNGALTEYRGDKQPVGYWYGHRIAFTQHDIPLQENDLIYTLSDGYADQFGGEKGKKFKYANVEKLLVQVSRLEMEEQKLILVETFEKWKGNLEQIDDVLVIGVKV
jgi:ligand-binding sensor domain-containing protein/serine phosphatase RsbU (regulator of sigma subunit)